ncbi:histidine ammonia-lyase [Bartonella melophagi K-2C]|uniref:Histidine ammonia-lyase n=1 Tax=Bartonella melophagi K-2C TaxID=1094557 RepID=J0QVE9_9HYPH|nr:histidine ammonia-lyase [Bartonella melophagi K-2C]
MTIILKPGEVTLSELESVYWGGKISKLHEDTHLAIKKGAARIAEIAAGRVMSQFMALIPVLES